MKTRSRLTKLAVLCVVMLLSTHVDGLSQDEEKKKVPDYLKSILEKHKRYLEENVPRETDTGARSARAILRPSGPVFDALEIAIPMVGQVESDSVLVARFIVPRARVRDREAISYLVGCCAPLDHPDSVQFIDLYDFARSGFGNGNVMIASPSGNSYVLSHLAAEFKDIAATWQLSRFLQRTDYSRETSAMDDLLETIKPPRRESAGLEEAYIPSPDLPPGENREMALRAVFAMIHSIVKDQYGTQPIMLYFERDSVVTSIELWGYEQESLNFKYRDIGSGERLHDLLTVTVHDSVIEAYHRYLDLLVIKESRRDTVYTPRRNR